VSAPQSPAMTTPTKPSDQFQTKASCNSDIDHGKPDEEETDSKIDAKVEMEADKVEGKTSNYQGYLKFGVQETWVTGSVTVLEDTDLLEDTDIST
jgi:hypothetical protein